MLGATGRVGQGRGVWPPGHDRDGRAAPPSRPLCSGCGAQGLKIKDHRVKPWRASGCRSAAVRDRMPTQRCTVPIAAILPEAVEWAQRWTRATRATSMI